MEQIEVKQQRKAIQKMERQQLDEVYDMAGPPQQASHQEGDHEESTLQLAREVGMEQIEVKQQRKAMQEMEIEKKRQLDEVKQAIPNETINVSSQVEMWRKISEEQSWQAKQGREREKGSSDQHKPPNKEKPLYDLPDDNEGSHSQRHPRCQYQLPARSQSGHYQQSLDGHPHDGHNHHEQLDAKQQHHSLNQPYNLQAQNQAYSKSQHQTYTQSHPQTQPLHHHPPHPQPRQNVAYDGQQTPATSLGLEVGSAVQLANNDSRTGVIRWIGNFSGLQNTIAGVELVSDYQCVKDYYVAHMYTGQANGELW